MAEKQAAPKREVWEKCDWVWLVATYAILGIYIAMKFGNSTQDL
jgi:hypothetical protein